MHGVLGLIPSTYVNKNKQKKIVTVLGKNGVRNGFGAYKGICSDLFIKLGGGNTLILL